MIDARIDREVTAAVGSRLRQIGALGGGCVSPAFRVDLVDGRSLFLKLQPEGAAGDVLAAEAASLARLAGSATVRVPAVLAAGTDWLALEWLEPAAADDGLWRDLGRRLARLHRRTDASFGLAEDNFIGPLQQQNSPSSSWPEFWWRRRLEPQLARARPLLGTAVVDGFESLRPQLPELLAAAAVDGPSLLHGDLWRGNVHATRGAAALIDPSSYFGHREVDLAMASLFGGFPAAFREAYDAEWPLQRGWQRRRSVYQLYYLLVHVNLFGRGYVASTEATLRAALG